MMLLANVSDEITAEPHVITERTPLGYNSTPLVAYLLTRCTRILLGQPDASMQMTLSG